MKVVGAFEHEVFMKAQGHYKACFIAPLMHASCVLGNIRPKAMYFQLPTYYINDAVKTPRSLLMLL